MDINRKGICINVGNCKNADSKLQIEVSVAADFICPECGRDLVEVPGKKQLPVKKIALFAVIPVVVMAIGAFYFLKVKNAVSVATEVDSTISKSVAAPVAPVPTPTVAPSSEQPPAAPSRADNSTVTAPAPDRRGSSSTGGEAGHDIQVGDYATFHPSGSGSKSSDQMDGILTFKSAGPVAKNDPQNRVADAGDKIIGTFLRKGIIPVAANWIDKNGNPKGKIFMGAGK